MSSGLPRMFVELQTTYFIETTGVVCSDYVRNNRVQDDCLLREPSPITVTLCVLLDNSEWIFGTYKLNVFIWLELLLLCMIFFTCAHIQIFFSSSRLQVQSSLEASNNTGILNPCTPLWLTESEQATPVVSIKDVVRSSVKIPEFNKHPNKAGGHIGWNIVEITIKMNSIVRKPLMIKINKLWLRNLDNKHLKKAGGHICRNVVEITIKMKTIARKPLMIKINKLRLRNLDN